MSNIRRMFKHLLPSTFFLFEDMSNVNSDLSIDSLLCITSVLDPGSFCYDLFEINGLRQYTN